MDITALKSPLVLIILAGSVVVTNIVTYNIMAPGADYCSEEVATALEQLQDQHKRELEEFKRATKPAEGLNPDRGGGLNWKDSIR